ncbi:unnamed protein product [Closterium sp. NIES-64]|nr:unnamed protein product [Closterium sp. NIES-64]
MLGVVPTQLFAPASPLLHQLSPHGLTNGRSMDFRPTGVGPLFTGSLRAVDVADVPERCPRGGVLPRGDVVPHGREVEGVGWYGAASDLRHSPVSFLSPFVHLFPAAIPSLLPLPSPPSPAVHCAASSLHQSHHLLACLATKATITAVDLHRALPRPSLVPHSRGRCGSE